MRGAARARLSGADGERRARGFRRHHLGRAHGARGDPGGRAGVHRRRRGRRGPRAVLRAADRRRPGPGLPGGPAAVRRRGRRRARRVGGAGRRRPRGCGRPGRRGLRPGRGDRRRGAGRRDLPGVRRRGDAGDRVVRPARAGRRGRRPRRPATTATTATAPTRTTGSPSGSPRTDPRTSWPACSCPPASWWTSTGWCSWAARPDARRFADAGEQPRLVAVDSPHQEISATHLEVRPGTGPDAGVAVLHRPRLDQRHLAGAAGPGGRGAARRARRAAAARARSSTSATASRSGSSAAEPARTGRRLPEGHGRVTIGCAEYFRTDIGCPLLGVRDLSHAGTRRDRSRTSGTTSAVDPRHIREANV